MYVKYYESMLYVNFEGDYDVEKGLYQRSFNYT